MAEQNPIKYSDLISPDDSIEKLITQLEQLNTAYTGMADSVKEKAKTLSDSLKKVSGATEQGRKTTKEASEEAQRLEKTWKQLEQATSRNAQEIAKLNEAKRQMNNYNKLIVERGKEEIRTSEQIANASYRQLSAQYSLNKAIINSLSAKDREIKKNKELIKSTRQIYEQMKQLQAQTGKMQLNVGNYPLQGLANGLGMVSMRMLGVTSAGMAAVGILKNNITTAKEYEKSISVLAAILGTTKDQIGELTEQAQHLGATTVFTAHEVAELQTELAKLGYSTQDILNMSPAVLNFAQATGSSLAEAASLTGAALRMFEADTKDTVSFVDKMTASTTKSALSFSYLNNALSTVGPVANSFGFKIEEVLALLGQLANAGFDASSAATATRNILLNLADANGKLAKALGQPVTNLDELIAGFKTLNDRGIDLAESLDLTDKRSVAAFNTFLAGTDTVINLRDELVNADGAAEQMAKTMGDNLEGSLKSLSSAWEGFNLHLNTSNGLFRDIIDWITKVVRWMDRLVGKIDSLWKKYGWMFRPSKQGAQEAFAEAFANAYGNADDEGGGAPAVASVSSGTSGGSSSVGGGGKKGKKGKNGKSAAQIEKERERQRQKELRAQERYEKESLEYRRKFEDAMIELYDDEYTKERAKTVAHYERLKEDAVRNAKDLQSAMMLVLSYENQKQMKLADLFEKEAKDQQEREKRDLQARIQATDMMEKEEQTARERRQRAIEQAANYALDSLSMYMDAWVAAAEKRLAYYDKEVDVAQKAVDAEIEARNNGYAANVALAQKELDQARKNQQKALREQQRAQKAQEMLDTATQVSSLVTATANIWSSFTKAGPWGIAAAIAATALMFGSFAAAKIKAASISGTGGGEEQYGEGTVELLQGGSHQSGNDIDLGRKKDGTRRRAEGGEYFAVINRRSSRRYRSLIPDVIHALNDGTFAQKYQRAYGDGGIQVSVTTQNNDLRSLSSDVRLIREQGEQSVTYDRNGNEVMRYKNLRRIIKN